MKWTMPTISIQTGLKTALSFLLPLVFAFQCGKKIEPKANNYEVWVHNTTSASISLNFEDTYEVYPKEQQLLITAYDSTNQFNFSPFGFNNSDAIQDPIKQLLDNFSIIRTFVYRNDSLKVTWKGPAADLPDSVHSFFNYNSWEIKLTPDVPGQTGTINFYIEEADLE